MEDHLPPGKSPEFMEGSEMILVMVLAAIMLDGNRQAYRLAIGAPSIGCRWWKPQYN